MVQSLFLESRLVVAHVLLLSAEYASWLHGAASLWAEKALDHYSSAHVESPTVVANPIVVWNFINSIASLVHRNVASSTKYNQILVFVVAVVADGTLGVLLNH